MRHFNFLSNIRWFTTVILLVTFGIGQMWGTIGTLTLSSSNKFGTSSGSTKNDDQGNTWTCTCPGIQNSYQTTYSGQQFGTGKTPADAKFTCTIAGATITSVKATMATGAGGTYTIKVGGDTKYSGSLTTTATEYGGTSATGTGEIEIKITKGTKASYLGQIVVVYTTASCGVNPSIGGASLNGSFNLATVGVQCTSITPGSNCSVASGDYGFIWYANDGTKKEIGGTGVTKVAVTSGAYSSGSFSANLTSTFVLGNRYSVRAFATNGRPATAYSDTITFQPRSVTFNLNGHGSSTPSTQYVNNGGKATNPSYSESVTGYTFGGWYKEAGCSNSWTFGTDVVSGANKTLYAKWTAKTYTIDLDQDLTPTSAGTTSISVTYNANTNLTSAITKPTKTGWTFAGYYTAKNGGGTQIIDADGNVLASKAGYTDASKNWIGTSDVTLYAKWTCTVTWSVNGATNVYDAQTLTYNGTSTKVASVPSGSDLDLENDYCGDVFVGWTTTNIGSTGLDKGDDSSEISDLGLFTTVAGSPELKTVGNTTFYAVFADYTTD